uniref:Cleft lip and palate associated transmembrane protein 1 n=1 Tax=Macrostomum lignano TaxID=282301 RepID=A0A1I8FTN5_9PLAT
MADAAAIAPVAGEAPAAAAGDAQQGGEQQQRPNGWAMVKGFIVRMLIIYFISSLFRRGQQPQTAPGDPSAPASAGSGFRVPCQNIFPKNSKLDLWIFVNEQQNFTRFNEASDLFWHQPGLVYGDWESGENRDGVYYKHGKIKVPETVMKNGSLYIHTFVVRPGNSPDPSSRYHDKRYTMHSGRMLTKYKRRRVSNTQNLITGSTEGPLDKEGLAGGTTHLPPSTHWHPNLTISLIDDHTPWTPGSLPPPLDEYVQFHPPTNEYYPILYYNDYWNLNSDYMPVNDTTPLLNLTVTFQPLSLFRWQLYAAQSMRNKWYGAFLGEDTFQESDEEQDTLKRTLVETNPYLLALTVVVSLVHSVFEFLAFKNDIQFWRSRQSLEGLSVRSVFFSVFQSVVVLLYVMDNETNFVVRVSVFVGLLIELWKIKKVVDIQVDWTAKLLGLIPRVHIREKSTYTESPTKKYDQMAFRYLSWLLFPLLGMYAVYSLLYQEHKSWYSWVLSMLYGFLLTFGFIMMTPQLFINYKMKSVAHLPWRMLTYKALNTFIDDIFAFVIRMPTLYRIGCLRDDVIFFIYLYQRYIYPMDPKRVNEYGVSQEMLQQPEQDVANAAETPAVPEAVEEETASSGVTNPEEKKEQ